MANYYDAILKSLPKAAFKLNDAGTAYIDAAGNGNTLTGTLSFVSPILNPNAKALSVNTATAVQTTTQVFKRGTEHAAFSLNAWVLPTTFTGTISILSHTGIYDGLAFDGDSLRFRVTFSTLGTVEAKWPVPDFPEVYHVVGVYSVTKIQLFVNKVLVASADISEEQTKDGFAAEPSAILYCGQSVSGTERLIVDGIAIFNRATDKHEIAAHFLAGRNVPSQKDAVAKYGGTHWDGVRRDIILETSWPEKQSWDEGIAVDTSSSSGVLRPEDDPTTEFSIAGTWSGSMGIASTESTSLSGVKAAWNGDGSYLVEYSLDGTTFATLTNGQLIPTTVVLNTTGKTLDIRVTFTGGIVDDPAEIRNLTLIAYNSNKAYGSEVSRDLLLTGVVGGDTYIDTVLVDSPWGFWLLAETTGTALADSSGNARGMTINLSAATLDQPGPPLGKSIAWSTAAGYAITTAQHTTSPATAEAWVYLTATPAANTVIVGSAVGYNSGAHDKSLYVDTVGKVAFMYYDAGGSTRTILSPTALSLNAWHHVVASVGAAGGKLRIDKVASGTDVSTTSYTGSGQCFLIRASGASINGTAAMRVAAPAFYTTQLSDARIDAHYDAGWRTIFTGEVSTALQSNEPIERNSAAGLSFYGGYATLKADVAGVVRTNLVLNPNFDGGSYAAWIVNAGGTGSAVSSVKSHSGTQSFRVIVSAENWGYLNPWGTICFPNITYTFSVWVCSDTDQSLVLKNYNTPVSGPAVNVVAGVWERLYLTQTIPGASTAIFLSVRRSDATMANSFYMDDLMIEQSSVLGGYFDGDDKGVWTGTARASTSVDNIYVPKSIAALEFWVKPEALTASRHLFDARPPYNGYIWQDILGPGLLEWLGASAVYINGLITSSNVKATTAGEWMHIIYVPTTPFNTDIFIGVNFNLVAQLFGQIGLLATYPTAPTATQALALYNSYTKPPVISVTDTAGITVAELSNSYTKYAYDWSITGAGV